MGRAALVLGAGLGGIAAAQALRRRLPRDDRVVLVDRAGQHVFAPSLPWLLVGRRDLRQISCPLAQAATAGIEFVRGEITRIDAGHKTVEVDGRTLRADATVIALGADYDTAAVAGLADAGHCIYTPAGVGAGRCALASLPGGRIVFLTAAPQYKCPAAPYETALLVEDALRRRGLRDRMQIDFYAEPLPQVRLRAPSRLWHGVKVLHEKYWLHARF